LPTAKGQGHANTWETLAKVKFKPGMDPQSGMMVDQPVFSPEVQALNGKEIIIKGYLLPEKGYKTHREFILSALPYNLCFFCGKAGPETVMEVSSNDPVRYSEEPITLKGKLLLNVLDPYGLPYILMDAELVK
jgi:hypothetical protein